MPHFEPNHYIFLTDSELDALVSAANRHLFPGLAVYLRNTRRLRQLRQLGFSATAPEWEPPLFSTSDQSQIIDDKGIERGRVETMLLPARSSEPQLALSHDWFWEAFSSFLREHSLWTTLSVTELTVFCPSAATFSIEELWNRFWQRLSAKSHLAMSVDLFLNNKTLFKNQAKPWGPGDIPILSADMANHLIHYYQRGSKRNQLFKQASIPKAIQALQTILQKRQFASIPLPLKISEQYVKGGDWASGRSVVACFACGEIIAKKKGHERLALFVKDADERPQSGKTKDDKTIFCPRCVATVFLCPVKLTPETLAVRFIDDSRTNDAGATVQHELRKYVAQTLHVTAGSFIALHLNERVDGAILSHNLGARHYALWKMAKLFPPELFAQEFEVEVYPGEEHLRLPQWLLWIVSSLAAWDDVFQFRCYRTKEYRPHFGHFLRLISRKLIFQSFYILVKGGLIRGYSHSWRMNQLQEIWSQLESVLKKENPMPIPDYPRIAGFAGLLLPLAERVENSAATDKKRAIGKLLEEVDRPIQYAYTASRESGSKDFIFCQRPRNRYFFEKALELLEWAGEDVNRLQSEGERIVNENEKLAWARNAEQKIFISPDQIARVTAALVKEGPKPYENEADWRAFAYQVKLALWSMFPQYLGSDKQ